VKPSRPGFGPAAELPTVAPAQGVTAVAARDSLLQLIRGNRRAAVASARGTGRAAYTEIRWADTHLAREADSVAKRAGKNKERVQRCDQVARTFRRDQAGIVTVRL